MITATPSPNAPAALPRRARATRSDVPADPPGLPTHQDIARRAYALWEAAGRLHGGDLEHWFRAERELMTSPFAARTPPL